jgi:hypothetical protein
VEERHLPLSLHFVRAGALVVQVEGSVPADGHGAQLGSLGSSGSFILLLIITNLQNKVLNVKSLTLALSSNKRKREAKKCSNFCLSFLV